MRLDDRLQLRVTAEGQGDACGKAILLGEHFVVHGTPALAVPVRGRRVSVSVAPRPGPWGCDAAVRPHLERMLHTLGVDPADLTLLIEGDLPVGVGLGSSAALAVALVRALGVTEPSDVQRLAHRLEGLAHGNPSGIDDAVATLERPVWFRRGHAVEPLAVTDATNLWIIVSPPGPPTHEAVARVAAFGVRAPERFDEILAEAEQLAVTGRAALEASDWPGLGAAMDAAHRLLVEVGVSTSRLDALCRDARTAGAYGAKLTGAGLGGAVIAVAPEGLDLARVLGEAADVEVFRA